MEFGPFALSRSDACAELNPPSEVIATGYSHGKVKDFLRGIHTLGMVGVLALR